MTIILASNCFQKPNFVWRYYISTSQFFKLSISVCDCCKQQLQANCNSVHIKF